MKSPVGSLIFVVVLCLSLLAPEIARAEKIVFATQKIKLAAKIVTVEIADTEEKRAYGLMYRSTLPENRGMLFIFENEQPLGFWMKNTLIPLAIGYFDKDKKLINVHEMIPAVAGEKSPKTYHSRRSAMYALEMSTGWFTRNKVLPGASFSFVTGH